MSKYIEDVLIILGAVLIAGATFTLSVVAGLYASGVILVLLGVGYAKYAGKKGGK